MAIDVMSTDRWSVIIKELGKESSRTDERRADIPVERQTARAACFVRRVLIVVNVSAVEFEAPDFIDIVHKALSMTQLPPHRLELELTETVVVRDQKLVLDRMNELREVGVLLSMDDFGAGQSSLGYLRRFPFHKIKIDQSFVRGTNDSGAAHEIVGAIAELGKSLGMSVLAEGVESDIELRFVREHGCSGVAAVAPTLVLD